MTEYNPEIHHPILGWDRLSIEETLKEGRTLYVDSDNWVFFIENNKRVFIGEVELEIVEVSK
jgi:hypothetical protein